MPQILLFMESNLSLFTNFFLLRRLTFQVLLWAWRDLLPPFNPFLHLKCQGGEEKVIQLSLKCRKTSGVTNGKTFSGRFLSNQKWSKSCSKPHSHPFLLDSVWPHPRCLHHHIRAIRTDFLQERPFPVRTLDMVSCKDPPPLSPLIIWALVVNQERLWLKQHMASSDSGFSDSDSFKSCHWLFSPAEAWWLSFPLHCGSKDLFQSCQMGRAHTYLNVSKCCPDSYFNPCLHLADLSSPPYRFACEERLYGFFFYVFFSVIAC